MATVEINEEAKEVLELELSFLRKDLKSNGKRTGIAIGGAIISVALLGNGITEVFSKRVDNLTLGMLLVGAILGIYAYVTGKKEQRLLNRIKDIESALRTGYMNV